LATPRLPIFATLARRETYVRCAVDSSSNSFVWQRVGHRLGPVPGIESREKSEVFPGNEPWFSYLDLEEERKLFASATPYIHDVASFAVNTGLRIGEILTLTWDRVDLENNLLNVFARKTHKIRPVPLNREARRRLEYWALGKRNEFVFYNQETGKPFVDLDAGFALACRKSGIEGVTWHTLRHTFASRLVSRGVDIVTVQQLLGHSTVTVTMRYTHTNLDSKRSAVAKLESFGDNLVTPCTKVQQSKPKVSPIAPLKAVASYT
jgi:integrase